MRFKFLLGVLLLASNFLGVSRAIAATDPCQPITTLQDLRDMGTTGNYCLANDIDASSTLTSPFTPIGSLTNPFNGVFDGNGHVIDKLTPVEYFIGLFGSVGSLGIVRNVGITNGASAQSSAAAGLLVGQNNGTVMNCFATGTVSDGSGGGGPYGGLIGWNNGTVTNSHAMVSVQAWSQQVGGLVGFNDTSGTITQSYASGGVSVTPLTQAGTYGGFVGENLGTITASYATGNVTGFTGPIEFITLGGFVGINWQGGKISQSYAIGTVTGDPGGTCCTGGFAGKNIFSGTISQSYSVGFVNNANGGGFVGYDAFGTGTFSSDYWDTTTSGQSRDGARSGTTGLTTSQLKAGLPSGFDPAVWGINASINTGYPYLPGQIVTPVAAAITKTTAANTPVTIDLTAGASGNPTSAAPVGTPVGGTVTGFPAMTVTFTPTTGFSGTASFQFTLANASGTSNTATATITVTPSPLAPVAVNQTASTSAGTPVTINLSAGASGKPTSAAIVSGPAHGLLKFISKTKVTYTLTACFLGTDSFQFTLANAFGTSNVATATITITAVSAPTTAVHLVDPFLLGKVISNFDQSNIDLTQVYRAQKWLPIQANGLLADNTSAAIAVIQTNDCANAVSLTTTNGTTLADYSPDFLTTSPTLALPDLPIPVSKFQYSAGFFFAAALVQAPAVGATYSLSTLTSANPITVTAVQGSTQKQATMSLVIPPVVLVHGIWGHRTDLKFYENSLGALDPWKLYLSASGINLGIRPIQYQNDIAFDRPIDDPEYPNTGTATLNKIITSSWARLDTLHFVGGRVDVVAHSMGGLVARALAGQQTKDEKDHPALSLRDRRQGTTIHQIITLDTPEKGSALTTFLLNNKDATYQNMDGFPIGPLVRTVWTRACGKAPGMTVAMCFDNKLKLNISGGGVASLDPENPCLKIIPGKSCLTNVAGPAEPKWIWTAISAVVPQQRRQA